MKVHTTVHIGPPKDMEGYGLAVDIKVEGEIVDKEVLKVGHEVCLDSMVNLPLKLKLTRFLSFAHSVALSPMEPKLESLWLTQ